MRFSKLLKSFIESKITNVFITLVILINAVTLGFETSEKLVSKIHKDEHDLLPKVINELCMNNIYLNCETNKVMYSDNLDSKMYVTYFND